MKAIVVGEAGDEESMRVGEVQAPELRAGSLRLRVRAAAVNRADLLQRQGRYPPPPGVTDVMGLECAGEVVEVGEGVEGWSPGDRAMALLPGGGYAEEVVVDAGSAMPVPERLSFEEAAAVPEVFLTVFLNVFQLGALPAGGRVLVHGGGSGIGTAAIQLVSESGGECLVTAGSPEKCARCVELGAADAFDYTLVDFADAVAEVTEGQGVDVVLDSIGAPYFDANLRCLKPGGRLVLIGLMGGHKLETSLAPLLARRLTVIGSTLRARPEAEKAELVRAFLARFGDALASGAIGPVVDRVLPLAEVGDAHRRMKESGHFGKLVLTVG